jgi:drug/metabolite transporter (DMT)-like permease
MTASTPRNSGLLHLLVVYLAWGSTFLAIRYAVQGEGVFEPLTLAALRVGSAGLIMLAYAAVTNPRSLVLSVPLLKRLALSGVFLWVGGHAFLIWAARTADSGFSAIIFATIPLWIQLLELTEKPRRRPSLAELGPVLAGFAGILILTVPEMSAGREGSMGLWVTLVLLASAFSWSFGTHLQTDEMARLPASVSAGYQQVVAATVCLVGAVLTGEKWTAPSPMAWMSVAYLISVGSVLAFTSYVRALQLLPKSLVASFAYVNPVIAVALGASIAGEKVDAWMIAGAVVVLASVVWQLRKDMGDGRKRV